MRQPISVLRKVMLAAAVVATVGLSDAAAQSQEERCARIQASAEQEKNVVEQIKDKRLQEIDSLPSEQQKQAQRNVLQWYWGVMAQIERKAVADCRHAEIRPDPPIDKESPKPGEQKPNAGGQQPPAQSPNPGNQQPRVYPPYQSPGGGTYDPWRPSVPQNPFSPPAGSAPGSQRPWSYSPYQRPTPAPDPFSQR